MREKPNFSATPYYIFVECCHGQRSNNLVSPVNALIKKEFLLKGGFKMPLKYNAHHNKIRIIILIARNMLNRNFVKRRFHFKIYILIRNDNLIYCRIA